MFLGENLVDILIQKFKNSKDLTLKRLYQNAFRKLGEDTVTKYAINVLNDSNNSDDKIFAIQELSAIQSPKVYTTLIDLMNNKSEDDLIRTTCIEALCFQPITEVVTALEEFIFNENDEFLTYTACHSLSLIWNPKKLESCEKILALSKDRYYLEMTTALEFIRKKVAAKKIQHIPPNLIESILRLARSENKDLRYSALKAINHLKELPFAEILNLLEKESVNENKGILFEILGGCAEENKDEFLKWLATDCLSVKNYAIQIFKNLEGSDEFKAQIFLELIKICENYPDLISESLKTVISLTVLSSSRKIICSMLCRQHIDLHTLIALTKDLPSSHREHILTDYIFTHVKEVKSTDLLLEVIKTLKQFKDKRAQHIIATLFLSFSDKKEIFRGVL